jgi:hypothetical protein
MLVCSGSLSNLGRTGLGEEYHALDAFDNIWGLLVRENSIGHIHNFIKEHVNR